MWLSTVSIFIVCSFLSRLHSDMEALSSISDVYIGVVPSLVTHLKWRVYIWVVVLLCVDLTVKFIAGAYAYKKLDYHAEFGKFFKP